MKTFTPEEIKTLEDSLKIMQQGHAEVELSQLNQENCNELVLLFNLIVGEYAETIGKEAKVLGPLVLEKLTEETLNNVLNIMNEASVGLVEIAKSRMV